MRKFFLIWMGVLTLLWSLPALATHNRAGEIIYEHVSGYTYKVTIITITKASSQADRPWLKIYWGDEPSNITDTQLDSLPRSVELFYNNVDAKRNEYYGYHTYSGPGIYTLMVIDPNRNSGVVNITNSVQQVFSIQSQLLISPGVGHNNSVQLLNPPTQEACIYQPWIHNPAAYDPDGDSLSYQLVSCLGDGGLPLSLGDIPAWVLPNEVTSQTTDVFTIDPFTGDVNWITPLIAGEYNIAIKITEWRNGVPIGFVIRDMQIDVITCSNIPPIIMPIADQCVTAGDNVNFTVSVSDPNGDNLMLEAFGGPMTEVIHQASFNGISRVFNWNPQCDEIRSSPYQMTFQVTDDGFVNLSDIETMTIKVVAPKVENAQAQPFNNGILVSWNVHNCASIFSEYESSLVEYWIYRRNGTYGFVPSNCELGVPSYTGYQFLTAVSGVNSNQFLDQDVNFGANYCYMIVARWPDGGLSYASDEVCAQLEKRVPIITKASVEITGFSDGADSIMWSPPIPEILNQYPGPFHYELLHGNAGAPINEVIYVGPSNSDLYALDTLYYHDSINTSGIAHHYRIALYSDTVLVGTSSATMTPWLSITPLDNAIDINVVEDVPWDNVRYQYYKKGPLDANFILWKDTTAHHLVDVNLINNKPYCYKVLTIGTYGTPGVPDPLYNWSQEACASPYDQSPPCPPVLKMTADCLLPQVYLHWNRPACADDITGYQLYYTPTLGGDLQLLASFSDPNDTTFILNEDLSANSIAGCYGVTALDSLNLWPDGAYHQNESVLSDTLCADNCPTYALPNIFTPNGDEHNDEYISFPYRSIDHVEMKIFNRWGVLVYETTDPAILWNGADQFSGQLCGDGVYFYTIQVFEIRLKGIIPYAMSGNIQLVDGKVITPKQ